MQKELNSRETRQNRSKSKTIRSFSSKKQRSSSLLSIKSESSKLSEEVLKSSKTQIRIKHKISIEDFIEDTSENFNEIKSIENLKRQSSKQCQEHERSQIKSISESTVISDMNNFYTHFSKSTNLFFKILISLVASLFKLIWKSFSLATKNVKSVLVFSLRLLTKLMLQIFYLYCKLQKSCELNINFFTENQLILVELVEEPKNCRFFKIIEVLVKNQNQQLNNKKLVFFNISKQTKNHILSNRLIERISLDQIDMVDKSFKNINIMNSKNHYFLESNKELNLIHFKRFTPKNLLLTKSLKRTKFIFYK